MERHVEDLRHEVNHAAVCSAAETMIPVIQFQAWVPVLVEWAQSHAVAVHRESVILRGLACRDARFDNVEVYCPMSISPRPVLICVFPYMINSYMYCARREPGKGKLRRRKL